MTRPEPADLEILDGELQERIANDHLDLCWGVGMVSGCKRCKPELDRMRWVGLVLDAAMAIVVADSWTAGANPEREEALDRLERVFAMFPEDEDYESLRPR